jgi:Zn finger protein HypA/HybF involved in hydrogenase expression
MKPKPKPHLSDGSQHTLEEKLEACVRANEKYRGQLEADQNAASQFNIWCNTCGRRMYSKGTKRTECYECRAKKLSCRKKLEIAITALEALNVIKRAMDWDDNNITEEALKRIREMK